MRDIPPTTPAFRLGAPTTADPDAELIAMRSELDGLERARKASKDPEDEDAYAPLEALQDELLLRIWAAPAHSLTGIHAKARSFVVWMPEALEAEVRDGFEWNYTSSILRDLLQGFSILDVGRLFTPSMSSTTSWTSLKRLTRTKPG